MLPGEQGAYVVIAIEVDLEVLGDLGPPLRQPAGTIAVGGQGTQRIGIAVELGRLRTQLLYQLTLCSQFQEQAGTVRLLGAVERGQAACQLLTGSEGTRVALLAQDLVGAFDQGLGAGDVLQGRQAQGSQAQQVLGFSQAPLLAAFA
ncbi:hypothetical protein D3C80_1577990 [compost metagenome]